MHESFLLYKLCDTARRSGDEPSLATSDFPNIRPTLEVAAEVVRSQTSRPIDETERVHRDALRFIALLRSEFRIRAKHSCVVGYLYRTLDDFVPDLTTIEERLGKSVAEGLSVLLPPAFGGDAWRTRCFTGALSTAPDAFKLVKVGVLYDLLDAVEDPELRRLTAENAFLLARELSSDEATKGLREGIGKLLSRAGAALSTGADVNHRNNGYSSMRMVA